jgi:hypothetical protein
MDVGTETTFVQTGIEQLRLNSSGHAEVVGSTDNSVTAKPDYAVNGCGIGNEKKERVQVIDLCQLAFAFPNGV